MSEALVNDVANLIEQCLLKDKEIERLKEENKRIFANVNDDELLISNAMNWKEKEIYKQALIDIKEYIETRAGTEIHDMMYVMETDEILDIVNKAIGE